MSAIGLASTRQEALVVTCLNAGYGKRKVLCDVTFAVEAGEIVAVVGPNGAGKSTLLKAIYGLNTVYSGQVAFNGKTITTRAPHLNVADSLLYLPQGNRVFEDLTVEENLLMGGYTLRRVEAVGQLAVVYGLFPELTNLKRRSASTLSGGERQMIAFGRALMLKPRLVMLDEPSIGLDPGKVKDVLAKIRAIREQTGCTVIIVEQKIRQVLEIVDRVILLKLGKIAFTGSPSEFRENASNLMLG